MQVNTKSKKMLLCSVLIFITSTMMEYCFANCTPCGAQADDTWLSPESSCPTWCCSAGLAYPVQGQNCAEGPCQGGWSSGWSCSVGPIGCAKGAVGCASPCGCS